MSASNDPVLDSAIPCEDSHVCDDRQTLLEKYRGRLRRMVAARLDRRLASRLDASDVVQDVFTDASRVLATYLQTRPIPVYPWLQQFAKQRLSKLHRDHLRSAKRSLLREQVSPGSEGGVEPSGNPYHAPVDLGESPSDQAVRNEERLKVLLILQKIPMADRQVLEMRYLEGLSFNAIAAKLGMGVSAVKMRHFRALGAISTQLKDSSDQSSQ